MAKIIADPLPEAGIKRLLRNQETLEYFKEDGWTNDPEEAKSFADVVEVAQTCARLRLEHVEMALRAGASGPDLFCTQIR